MEKKTIIEFTCPYTIEQRYEMAASGEYCIFEMYDAKGDVTGFRGSRKGFGVTGVYDSYRAALEAAFIAWGSEDSKV